MLARIVVRVDTELLLASPGSTSPGEAPGEAPGEVPGEVPGEGEAAQALKYSHLEAAPGTVHAHKDRLFYAAGHDFVQMFVDLWPHVTNEYSQSPRPEVSAVVAIP